MWSVLTVGENTQPRSSRRYKYDVDEMVGGTEDGRRLSGRGILGGEKYE